MLNKLISHLKCILFAQKWVLNITSVKIVFSNVSANPFVCAAYCITLSGSRLHFNAIRLVIAFVNVNEKKNAAYLLCQQRHGNMSVSERFESLYCILVIMIVNLDHVFFVALDTIKCIIFTQVNSNSVFYINFSEKWLQVGKTKMVYYRCMLSVYCNSETALQYWVGGRKYRNIYNAVYMILIIYIQLHKTETHAEKKK